MAEKKVVRAGKSIEQVIKEEQALKRKGVSKAGKSIEQVLRENGITEKSSDSALAKVMRRLPLASIFVPDEVGDGTRGIDQDIDERKIRNILKGR